ncbi:MAG: adenylate kinase [Mycoplasmatales bacterium]|nr:adenylate kinase [Mycoplasmatales bacterium]
MVKNYIFLGPPGVGKGTLASLIQEEKNIKHISTGEIFRNEMKKKTKLGLEVKAIIESGDYVPDNITNEIVKNVLNSDEVKKRGFILDGYPRTVNQAEFLKENKINLDGVILLDASDKVIMERLLGRGLGRADDDPKIISTRLDVYNKKTKPLINFYKAENLLVTINAEGTIEENYNRLIEAIN